MFEGNSVNVLIVEDELIVALNLSRELESLGFVIAGLAASENEALNLVKKTQPQVVLMDINLESGGSGINAASRIAQISRVPIIYVTAYSSDKIIELVGKTNPYGYILKPYNVREVKAVINTALIRIKFESKIEASERRLKVAMKAAELDVLEFDPATQAISMVPQTLKFAEFGFQKHMAKPYFLSMFCQRDADALDTLLEQGKPFSKRARLNPQKLNKHIKHYVDVFLSNICYANDTVQIGAIQDVSRQQWSNDKVQISDSVLSQMQESVLILDENDIILDVNPAFLHMVGYAKNEIIDKPIGDFLLRERKEDSSVIKRTRAQPRGQQQAEVTIKCKNGNVVDAMLTVSKLENIDGNKQSVLTLTDITRLVEAERRLHKIAFTDSLTGFGNRDHLNRLLKAMGESQSFNQVALFFIDLDSFKNINDTLGHEVGDKVLVEFAKRLLLVFREHDQLVRIGGDEFIAIITGIFSENELAQIAQKVLNLLADDFTMDERQIAVSCSLGIAHCLGAEFEAEALLRQADSAMYHAKKKGKNTFCFFDKGLADQTQYRIFIEQGLSAAVNDKLLSVFLQPIVDQNGKVTSVEALCRWYDSQVGFISPDIFIPVAEKSNLILALGFLVINESCLAKKQLMDAGYGDIIININFSEKQLQNEHTYTAVCELLTQYELEAEGFVIEITESILHDSRSDRTIKLLQDKGFKFAIDDFGTGYSSLSKLHDYSIDIVKIDKSFIDLLNTNTKQNKITRAIIDLGKNLGYKVVAEGVETIEQRDILVAMGCDAMQGFYYAKPLPMHKLLKYLETD